MNTGQKKDLSKRIHTGDVILYRSHQLQNYGMKKIGREPGHTIVGAQCFAFRETTFWQMATLPVITIIQDRKGPFSH